MGNSRTKVWQRRRKVSTLLVRGIPRDEIAEMLQIRKRTVDNDARVILSGKNNALTEYTRKQMITQLHLNAMERMRYLWRIVEEADRDYVKVQALRELRLNDERILARLPEPESEEEEMEKEEMVKQVQQLYKRVQFLIQRRKRMQETMKYHLKHGDLDSLRKYLDDFDMTAGYKEGQ